MQGHLAQLLEDQVRSHLVLVDTQGALDHMVTTLEQVIVTLGQLLVQQEVTNDLLNQQLPQHPLTLAGVMTIPVGAARALANTHSSPTFPRMPLPCCPCYPTGVALTHWWHACFCFTAARGSLPVGVPSCLLDCHSACCRGSLPVGLPSCLLKGLSASLRSCCPGVLLGWPPMGFPMALPCVDHPCLPGVLFLVCPPPPPSALSVGPLLCLGALPGSATLNSSSPASLVVASHVVIGPVPSLFLCRLQVSPLFRVFSHVILFFNVSILGCHKIWHSSRQCLPVIMLC